MSNPPKQELEESIRGSCSEKGLEYTRFQVESTSNSNASGRKETGKRLSPKREIEKTVDSV